ncbi:MAG: L-serine ammonia-lyase, iron-sulfur-dependent, subunit alpha [Eubacteriales bacterium]|nr:L-serine ammonia-lyase, iron-sulfur-dependent, subunit alpha [Eubacteriales bacterium]
MRTIHELLSAAKEAGVTLGEIALRWQMKESGETEAQLKARMQRRLEVMRLSVQDGLSPELRSASGKVGGQSSLMVGENNRFGILGKAGAYALAVAESNACMGKIVAAPTAGSCGILPGALFSAQEQSGFTDDELVMALFASAAIGRSIALQASVSGAEGGCQAECGSAAGMAAAALCQLYGGSNEAVCDACAFALMNMLGLVCDPVHGLVEIPCIYRNVGGVSQALAAAQMALAGVRCPIPCDEVICAMKAVGDAMPSGLRETGEGGCAACRSMA